VKGKQQRGEGRKQGEKQRGHHSEERWQNGVDQKAETIAKRAGT
jgi:hypothetical protein